MRKFTSIVGSGILALVMVAVMAPSGYASIINQVVATADLPGHIFPPALANYELGFRFQVTGGDRLINALGFVDLHNLAPEFGATGDGLMGAELLGIWKDDGTLLGSVIVPSGTGGILDGVWRY